MRPAEAAKPAYRGAYAALKRQSAEQDWAAVEAAGQWETYDGRKARAAEIIAQARASNLASMNEPQGGDWVMLQRGPFDSTVEYHKQRSVSVPGALRFVRYRKVAQVTPELLGAAIMDPSCLLASDKTMVAAGVLHEWPDKRTRLVTTLTHLAPVLLRDRHVFELYNYDTEDDGTVHVTIVGLLNGNLVSGALRAISVTFGLRLRPVQQADGAVWTQVTLVAHVIPRGAIPTWIANKLAHQIIKQYVSSFEKTTKRMSEAERRDVMGAIGAL